MDIARSFSATRPPPTLAPRAEESARENVLAGAALVLHRRDHIPPIVNAFAKWLAAIAPTLLPSGPLTAAARYCRLHWDALTRFVHEPQVPIDNSPTKREFQSFAKLRLNMLLAAGSTEGAHRARVLLGASRRRAIDVPAREYLAWAFEPLSTHRERFAGHVAAAARDAERRVLDLDRRGPATAGPVHRRSGFCSWQRPPIAEQVVQRADHRRTRRSTRRASRAMSKPAIGSTRPAVALEVRVDHSEAPEPCDVYRILRISPIVISQIARS